MVSNQADLNRALFLIALLISISTFSQQSSSKIEYGLPATKKFTPSEYGGEAQNLDFVQDEKGQLVVANTYGFLIYDGVRWKKFKPDNEGLPLSYAKGKSKRIYTGGTEFIGYLEPTLQGDYQYVDLTKKLPESEKVGLVWNTIIVDETIYFENTNSIISYSDDTLKVLSDDSKVNAIFEFEGEAYVSTKKGLYKVVKNRLKRIPQFDVLNGTSILNLFRLPNQDIAIISRFDGIHSWNASGIKPIKPQLSKLLKESFVMKFKELSDGNLAIGTSNKGLIITDSKHIG